MRSRISLFASSFLFLFFVCATIAYSVSDILKKSESSSPKTETKTSTSGSVEENIALEPSPTITLSPTPKISNKIVPPKVNTTLATVQSTNTNTNTNNTNSNRCIITLSGKQYDVTPLINSHPGGNVFVCGTDQTAMYQSQHGTDLSRMLPYLISSAVNTSTNNTSTNTNPSTNNSATSVQNNNTSNQCIITISGQQYNVTSLINSHPGGNVFVCGTDQTSVYQSQHGTNLSRMQPYLIGASSGSSSPNQSNNPPSSNPSVPSVPNNNDDREDEHELKDDDRDDSDDDREQEDDDRDDSDDDRD